MASRKKYFKAPIALATKSYKLYINKYFKINNNLESKRMYPFLLTCLQLLERLYVNKFWVGYKKNFVKKFKKGVSFQKKNR